jgi:uncharacterized protein
MSIVIILAKAPLPGRVKTRLSPRLTPDEAAAIAAAALADTLAAALDSARPSAVVAVFEGDPAPWIPFEIATYPQVTGGLDRRLAAAFNDVHAQTGEAMVLIAMDTPQVTGAMLDEACDALAQPGVDAVFGPAEDGGYWLIGVRALRTNESNYDDLFHDVPMSTHETGAAQRARLTSCGWTVHMLSVLRDIDTVDDITAVADSSPHIGVARVWRGILAAQNASAHLDSTIERGHVKPGGK